MIESALAEFRQRAHVVYVCFARFETDIPPDFRNIWGRGRDPPEVRQLPSLRIDSHKPTVPPFESFESRLPAGRCVWHRIEQMQVTGGRLARNDVLHIPARRQRLIQIAFEKDQTAALSKRPK